MGSELLPVTQNGIYHNLPQFDPNLKGLSAIITGANGISGFGTLRCLLDHPERWSKIYLISRRPPAPDVLKLLPKGTEKNIQHIPIDLLTDPKSIAKSLDGVKADYIFHYAYLQPKPPPGAKVWSNEEELVKVNAGMLQNFLDAIVEAGITPKRFLLQTGAKNYGAHLGLVRNPCVETDPQPKSLGNNFYYPQEDILFEYSRKHGVGWNVVMPPGIIGAVDTAQMNALFPYAVYAAVAAERGQSLVFPASWSAWHQTSHHGTARLTGYFSEWVILEDKCKDQRFNSLDTSPLSWDRFFEALTEWFGVEEGVKPPSLDETQMIEISSGGGDRNPMGYGPPNTSKLSFTLSEWAKDPENAKAYADIMKRENLQYNPWETKDDQFAFGDAALLSISMLSMDKARRLGWTGFVDTLESIFEMYQEMNTFGMAPKMKVTEARRA